METDPEGALAGFAEVVRMESEKAEWCVSNMILLLPIRSKWVLRKYNFQDFFSRSHSPWQNKKIMGTWNR